MYRVNRKAGFTLIELLVVIAIIGIIATVIMTFLFSARDKSKDSSIKQELNHLRTQASLYQAVHGEFEPINGNCNDGMFADEKIRPLLENADPDNNLCWSSGSKFIVAVPLKSDSTKLWCVDSSNNSRQISIPVSLPSDYICPNP